MKEAYFIGLDLGQLSDYTALTVVKRVCAEELEPEPWQGGVIGYRPHRVFKEYQLQHLKRFPLGTPYQKIAEGVKQLQGRAPLTERRSYVIADTTGVGLPVFEMLAEAGVKRLSGVTIHGGDRVSREVTSAGQIHRVPKRDLVSTLQVHLQNRTLLFAKGLPEAGVLKKELQHFKVKINIASGHDSYEAWREGDHDDLVLSLAMAVWFAENAEPDDWSDVRSVTANIY